MEIGGKNIRIQGRMVRMAKLAAEKYDFIAEPTALLDAMRQSRERIDLFTFLPRLLDLDRRYSYPTEPDNFAALAVSTYDQWWTKQIDNKTRNMVRRGEKKGLVTREVAFDDQLAEGIWKIYNEAPIRQGKPFPHYGKNLETVRRETATFLDRSLFIGAYVGDELGGFIKLIWDDEMTQAGIVNFVALIRHRDYAPTNALVAHAVRACADRHIPNLTYANFAYGNKQRDSLADFKENNGFQRVDVPRYYVPLTLLGSAAFRLGLHKRWADRVPETLINKYLEYRKAWYARQLQSAPQKPS